MAAKERLGRGQSGPKGSKAEGRGRFAFYRGMLFMGLAVASLAAIVLTVRILRLQRDLDADPLHVALMAVNEEDLGNTIRGAAEQEKAQERLRVAIAPVLSPEKSLYLYRDLVEYLAVRLGRTSEILPRSSYAEVNALLRHRHTDLAFVCSYAYLEGARDFGMEAIAIPVIKGKLQYYSYFIVPRSSSARTLLDLRGKRFASSDILSASGWLYPRWWLYSHDEDPSSFFADHIFVGGHDRSIEAVAQGYVDGAAVDSVVYDYMVHDDPQLKDRTKVIHHSPPFGMPPLVVHPDMDPVLRQRILDQLLRMHETPAGRHALAPLQIDRFQPADDGLYDSVREIAGLMDNDE